jgi:signal transduction histidine kinase
MSWSEKRTFAADSTTPRAARQFAVVRLGSVLDAPPDGPGVVDDIALIVSELVSNAVNAHASIVTVDLTVHRDHVRVAVSDDAAGVPVMLNPSPQAAGGRGLRIVEQLSRKWRVDPTHRGKRVWAEVPLHTALS